MDIVIGIDDWHDELRREETPVVNEEVLLGLIKKGEHTAKVARMAIVTRELGEMEDPAMIAENKLLIHSAAMLGVSKIVRKQTHTVKIGEEKYEVHDFEGRIVGEKEGVSYVSNCVNRMEKAQQYLDRVVPGHIKNRLIVIYECGGDVETIAQSLKDKIDEMVDELKP